jgi:hypothetical protein
MRVCRVCGAHPASRERVLPKTYMPLIVRTSLHYISGPIREYEGVRTAHPHTLASGRVRTFTSSPTAAVA